MYFLIQQKAKVPDFWCKTADKPQKVRHVIYMFFFLAQNKLIRLSNTVNEVPSKN